jgi:hypothetical protein
MYQSVQTESSLPVMNSPPFYVSILYQRRRASLLAGGRQWGGRAGGDFSDCSLRPSSYVRRCTYLVSRNPRVVRTISSSPRLTAALVHCSRARTSLSSSALVPPYGALSITTLHRRSRSPALAHGARAGLLGSASAPTLYS